jgi:hypothetical protein
MMSAMVPKPAARFGVLGAFEDARIGLAHHLLAEVDSDQIVLKQVVVEHVLGRLAQVDDPLGHGRRLHAERHVLRIVGAGGVVVAADPADAAGDEVGVSRILALHEDAVAAKDRGRRTALDHLACRKVDLGVDAETADDARDRIPGHLDELRRFLGRRWLRGHRSSSEVISRSWSARSRWSVWVSCGASRVRD